MVAYITEQQKEAVKDIAIELAEEFRKNLLDSILTTVQLNSSPNGSDREQQEELLRLGLFGLSVAIRVMQGTTTRSIPVVTKKTK